LRIADVEQSEVRSRTNHGKRAERIDDGHRTGITHGIDGRRRTQLVVRPFAESGNDIAFLVQRIFTFDNGTAHDAAHRCADCNRRHVLIHVAHPDAIRRIEREIVQAKQTLPVRRLRDRFLFEA
jgi:hypothetical protein